MKMLKIRNLAWVFLLVGIGFVFLTKSTNAQETKLEQDCYDAVQGKVAWNQGGSTSWVVNNVRSICKGTTDPAKTI